MKQNKIVVIIPHGDDEVLGFGGTIIKHIRNGDVVDVIFVKTSYNERSSLQLTHTQASANLIGFDSLYLHITPTKLANFNLETLQCIEAELIKLKPDILYTAHPGDVHQDHVSLFNYIKIATRINGPIPVPKILCGEIISSTSSGINLGNFFQPNHYEILTLEDVLKKQEALEKYSFELCKFPHARSKEGIMIHAQKRGMEAGSLYAEAFQSLRYINL